MALTSTGLSIPRLQEIIDALGLQLRENLGVDIDISEDSVAGVINSIYSNSLSDAYELIQAIYDSRDVAKAQGVQLDILATYFSTARISSSRTNGLALFTGTNGTSITQGSVASVEPAGDRFETIASFSISNLESNTAIVSVANVQDSTDYVITIDGSNFSITSDGTATETEIIDALETSLGTAAGYVVTRVDDTLTIQAADAGVYNPIEFIRVDLSSNLTFDSVSTLSFVFAEEVGAISALTNSLTKIETPVAGWQFITNPIDLTLGRELETDEELRIRLSSEASVSNAGTPDAITQRILDIENVQSVVVIENITSVIDGDGRPPKSYETLVVGGTDQNIGDVIWETKPAGIETFGSTSVGVTDFGGNAKTVYFSRPQDIYVHVQVEYTLYSEESFPSGGEAAMAAAVLSEGNLLAAGDDVIPRRFIGPVYDSTTGLQDVVVLMGTTPNPGDPTPALTEVTIPISVAEVSAFDSARITVVNV